MGKAELFLQLHDELKGYKKMMSEAAQIIMDKDVSDYPIFVVHQQEVAIGIPIAEREKVKGNWSVNASSLEEFVSKNIVYDTKIEDFKANYRDPEDFICIFVLSELGAQFIYLPKKDDDIEA